MTTEPLAACGLAQDWHGCYKGAFDLLAPESNAHPTKMAPALCYRIFAHLKELGLLQAGQTILDPMAGTGMTGMVAATLGHPAILIELEPRFVGFIQDNVKRLRAKGFQAEIQVVQGDARHLSELLKERGLVSITSPPYQDTHLADRSQIKGNTFSQIGRRDSQVVEGYGSTPGQIGAMKDRPLAITSPPYEDSINSATKGGIDWAKCAEGPRLDKLSPTASHGTFTLKYGQAEGQIGQERNEDYLGAMKIVYQQIALCSDVLVVVVKDPVRSKHIRELGKDTWRLLEATGWKLVDYHQAVLFEMVERPTLFGQTIRKPKGRVSFFQRLSIQKGSPAPNFEHVLFAVRADAIPGCNRDVQRMCGMSDINSLNYEGG